MSHWNEVPTAWGVVKIFFTVLLSFVALFFLIEKFYVPPEPYVIVEIEGHKYLHKTGFPQHIRHAAHCYCFGNN